MMTTALEMWTSQWGHEPQEYMVGGPAVVAGARAAAGKPERTSVDVVTVRTVVSTVSIHSQLQGRDHSSQSHLLCC